MGAMTNGKMTVSATSSPIPFGAIGGSLNSKAKVREEEKVSVDHLTECSRKLLSIVKLVDGFSGRSLRKLPFVTSVHHIDTPSGTVSVKYFLGRLEEMARIEMKQRKKLRPN